MDISTFVFFDIETTGLPYMERNQTKITELAFVAVSAREMELTPADTLPLVNKLTLFFNPERNVSSEAASMTRLSSKVLAKQPLFKERVKTLNTFLEELPKPVCLVAHNGNRFDFKILTTEYKDAKMEFPPDLLCIDSLCGFKKLDKGDKIIDNAYKPKTYQPLCISSPNETQDTSIMTDDEDEWPELNISLEEWQEIDELTLSLSDMSCEENKKNKPNINQKGKGKKECGATEKVSYTLSSLYKRLLGKEPIDAHRAEVDCMLLLECVFATKSIFLPWANKNAVPLSNIKPLNRYRDNFQAV